MPKLSVGESFTVAIVSGIEKVWRREGGGVSKFSVEFFLSHSAKTLVGEPFCAVFRKISGSEKVYGNEGAKYQDFPSEFFVLHCRKFP